MNIAQKSSSKTCQQVDMFDSAMKIVGDFWTLRIVEALRTEEHRFCGLERAIPDISPATLTTRLKRLEESGVIVRKVETLDKQSVCYILTERGKGILPVLDAIKEFTSSHLGEA